MKLKIILLLLLFCSGRSGRSESDSVDHGVNDEVVAAESWADAEIPTSSDCAYPTCHVEIECLRSQFLDDPNRPYAELHRAVELDMRPLDDTKQELTEQNGSLNPFFCGGVARYCLLDDANVRWFNQSQLLSAPESPLLLPDGHGARSTYFQWDRVPRPVIFSAMGRLSAEKAQVRDRYNSDEYFRQTKSSNVRRKWEIIQLRAIRLKPWAPGYSLAVRQVDFDQNEESSSTSEANSICAFERRAIRHMERNVDCEVVVDQQKDEIQIVGAVRRQGKILIRSGPGLSEGTLTAVFSYCLKKLE